jgi:hypothetical protein
MDVYPKWSEVLKELESNIQKCSHLYRLLQQGCTCLKRPGRNGSILNFCPNVTKNTYGDLTVRRLYLWISQEMNILEGKYLGIAIDDELLSITTTTGFDDRFSERRGGSKTSVLYFNDNVCFHFRSRHPSHPDIYSQNVVPRYYYDLSKVEREAYDRKRNLGNLISLFVKVQVIDDYLDIILSDMPKVLVRVVSEYLSNGEPVDLFRW